MQIKRDRPEDAVKDLSTYPPLDYEVRRRRIGAQATGAMVTGGAIDGGRVTGAAALALTALGAAAMGAAVIGALTIGRLVVGTARFRKVEIGELVVHKLKVLETA
jgi:hypothetical protein